MAIAAQLAQLIAEHSFEATGIADCSAAFKSTLLRTYMASMKKPEREVFFTESTEVFDPLPYLDDFWLMGSRQRDLMVAGMIGRIGDDVAGELVALRKQDRIEAKQEWRAQA